MKRRAISFVIALAMCLSLCPVRALAAGDTDPGPQKKQAISVDTTVATTYEVTNSLQIDTGGHSYTVSGQTAVRVTGTGRLYLTYGTIRSANGAGIEVLSGGFLRVDQAGMTVTGTTYGLDISSGAEVRLSGGTFTGSTSAIRAAGGDYGALLVKGYAYFDENGNTLLPANVFGVRTVTVQACTDHAYRYTPTEGAPTHDGICNYCGTEVTAPCTFDFDEDGHGECGTCGHTLDIVVDPCAADYDGAPKPDTDPVKVILDGSANKALTKDRDYTVAYEPRIHVGETAVTVTGAAYNGTFTKTFSVVRAMPEITWEWDTADPVNADYDGSPVDKTDLPGVNINLSNPGDLAELEPLLYFSYSSDGGASYAPGLPADAGTYQIKASLPETQNYEAASSDPITLTINKIGLIIEAPVAVKPVYNGAAQDLVTGGKVNPDAVGAVILFATDENGPWSPDIPTGISAGDYTVYYRVDGTGNYEGVGPISIDSVKIKRKEITPDVVLEYTSHEYTGGELQPAVTVSDKDDGTVLPVTEYTVTYSNNTDAGKNAAVTITDKDKGNYKIIETTVYFEITPANQAALTIINRPNSVIYGDVFTLETSGGSGSGTVTWEIVADLDADDEGAGSKPASAIAVIDENSGQVTVTGVGTVTVRATKSGVDYKETTAEWTFTAAPKPVTATVIADDKPYDGGSTATVRAVVTQGLAFDDKIAITGLSGTFDSADAGAGKTVTVTGTAVITVNGIVIANGSANENYIVTIPGTTTANITKAEITATAPTLKTPALTYNGSDQELVTAGRVSIGVSGEEPPPMEYSLHENGTYSEEIPSATDAGRYEVWYRVQESANYTGIPAAMVEVTIAPKTVTASDSNVALDPDPDSGTAEYYVYDGSEKRPAVTVKDGENVIDASEYTVTYSNNVSAGTATVTVTDNAGGNYTVSGTASFTIAKNTVSSPRIELSPTMFRYNGNQQKPTVTVRDDNGLLIADREYEVKITVQDESGNAVDTDSVDVGTYTVTITATENSNYIIQTNNTKEYKIEAAEQDTIVLTGTRDQVYYGDKIQLGITGGTGNGTVTWKIEVKTDAAGTAAATANTISTGGLLTINEVGGPYIVTATRQSSGGNYGDISVTWEFSVSKKAVTAILTGVDRDYIPGDVSAAVTARVDPGDLVNDDKIVFHNLDGTFDNPNVGTGKTITVTSALTVDQANSVNWDNYDITYDLDTVTASILPVKAEIAENGTPQAAQDLTYAAGTAHPLVTEGSTADGAMFYSLDGDVWTLTVPTGTNAGDYTVYYKVVGDSNHTDSDVGSVKVTIARQSVTPQIELVPSSALYDGTAKRPSVIVRDDGGHVIPESEYTVTYSGTDWTSVTDKTAGVSHTVTIGNSTGGNYDIATDTAEFTITQAEQARLTIDGAPDLVHYKDRFTLSIAGGSGNGKVTWSSSNNSIADIDPDSGLVTVNGMGTVTITVTKAASSDGSYKEVSATWAFTVVPANAQWAALPKAITTLVYEPGKEQELITGAATVNGIGTVEYSLDQTKWQTTIPTAENAGTYTVWYRVEDDSSGRWNGIVPDYVEVTVAPKTVSSPTITLSQNSYEYDGSEKKPTVTVKDGENVIDASEYTVTYSDNVNAGTVTVTVTDKTGGNYAVSGTAAFTITPKTVSSPTITLSQNSYTYDGSEKRPAVTVKDGENVIDASEYTVTYSDNVSAGTATVTVTDNAGGNYTVSGTASFTIAKNTVNNPRIELSPTMFRYNGNQQKPTVTVRDDNGLLIAEQEYLVTITVKDTDGNAVDTDSADVGIYTVTITAPANSNYIIQTNNTKEYKIEAAEQDPIVLTGTRDQVYYGDKIQLGITGGTGNGTVTWKIEVKTDAAGTAAATANTISTGGLLTINEVGGPYIVTATRKSSSGNYSDISVTWEFSVSKKTVTAVLTGENKPYDGTKNAVVKAAVNPGDLVSGDPVDPIELDGEFEDANVGTGKKITITSSGPIEVGNYVITFPAAATADITPKRVTAQVVLSNPSESIVYDGTEQTPDVTVTFTDEGGTAVTAIQKGSDYTITYSNNINAGTATVTVKNVDGGNYSIDGSTAFTIEQAAPTVTAPAGKTNLTYNGAAQELIDGGSSPHGTMMYSLNGADGDYSEDIPTGINAGDYTIYYKVEGDSNHKDTQAAPLPVVNVARKDISPEITVENKVYNGDNTAKVNAVWPWIGSDGSSITVTVAGTFESPDVGDNLTVNITITVSGDAANNYNITYPATATASITPAQLDLGGTGITVTPNENLTYDGTEQALVVVGGDGATLEYSLDGIDYAPGIPEAIDADTYTVWYRMRDDINHAGSVTVTIAKATPKIVEQPTAAPIKKGQTLSNDVLSGGKAVYGDNVTVPGKFTWKFLQAPLADVSLPVLFTPEDTDNFEIVELMVLATINAADTGSTNTPSTAEPGPETASTQTSVQDGTASTVVNSAAGNELVDKAVENQSETVVIKPEITDDVTKTEVSLPAPAVGRLGSETDASLTVSTPVADVTIPNGALGALSSAGGTVSVITERVENTVVLSLTADGEDVGNIPGGLTLTVPVEGFGPGTVAVLVNEDGTRKTIRWSVAEGSEIRIPLDGSAAVEIVDNSKTFSDVAADSWAADSVAFVSAHELFNGTGANTFSPDQSMTRGMLAVVLHNLENNPDTAFNGVFADVEDGAWYAEGVSWAADRGIVTGYGDGSFGAANSITREQLAVTLWRYAGSPTASGDGLNRFTDAGKISDWALDAMIWAVENGIINGFGSGILAPDGLATRAQAAKMLQNFMESI